MFIDFKPLIIDENFESYLSFQISKNVSHDFTNIID